MVGKRKKTRIYFPKAGVKEVGVRLVSALKRESVAPLVCVSVTRNVFGKVRREKLCRRHWKALGRISYLLGSAVNLWYFAS